MRKLIAVVAVALLMVMTALPASAHVLVVPGHDGVWVGGGPVPGQGQGLVESPVGILPPSHARGLVEACQRTLANSSAVVILAPPHFSGCVHGQP